jgi:hypothetical protein
MLAMTYSTMIKEIVVWLFNDGSKEIYDPLVHGVEKPWLAVYQLTTITRDTWEWILSHPDPREAVNRYFPNL